MDEINLNLDPIDLTTIEEKQDKVIEMVKTIWKEANRRWIAPIIFTFKKGVYTSISYDMNTQSTLGEIMAWAIKEDPECEDVILITQEIDPDIQNLGIIRSQIICYNPKELRGRKSINIVPIIKNGMGLKDLGTFKEWVQQK